MKVFLGLALIALWGQISAQELPTGEFIDLVQTSRETFQNLHHEYENALRTVRWEISDVYQEWNMEVLSSVAETSTEIINERYEIYDDILVRASELGNQNECLLTLDGEITGAANDAGNAITLCTGQAAQGLAETAEEFLFDFIREVQLESTNAQSYPFYEMANRNPLTEQVQIVNGLDGVYANGRAVLVDTIVPYFNAEVEYFNALANQAKLSIDSCLGNLHTAYKIIAENVRVRIPACS